MPPLGSAAAVPGVEDVVMGGTALEAGGGVPAAVLLGAAGAAGAGLLPPPFCRATAVGASDDAAIPPNAIWIRADGPSVRAGLRAQNAFYCSVELESAAHAGERQMDSKAELAETRRWGSKVWLRNRVWPSYWRNKYGGDLVTWDAVMGN